MKFFYTIQDSDLKKNYITVHGKYVSLAPFMGRVFRRDIGKRIYNINGVYQVENDEQFQKRIGNEKESL